jgi:hypothetical protein
LLLDRPLQMQSGQRLVDHARYRISCKLDLLHFFSPPDLPVSSMRRVLRSTDTQCCVRFLWRATWPFGILLAP